MNALDHWIDRIVLELHRGAWPLHTSLRSLRMPCPRWILPGVAGLTRQERRIVSGAMTWIRMAIVPSLLGAAVRFAARLAPPLFRAGLAFAGNVVTDVGVALMALGLGVVLAMRLRRLVDAHFGN